MKLKDFLNFCFKKNNYPTVEEAIDVIIDEFTEEQLEYLELEVDDKIYSFKDQLLAEYSVYKSVKSIEKIKEMANSDIELHKSFFKSNDKIIVCEFFISRFNKFFKKQAED